MATTGQSAGYRRPPRRSQDSRVPLYLFVLLLTLVGVIYLLKGRAPPPEPVLPTPTMSPSPVALPSSVPTPTPTPTATLVLMVLHSSEMVWPQATESPTPSPPRSQPTPTPLVSECVEIESSVEVSATWQTLVEVETRNRCWRELEPLDVWFVANGYINGSLVHSVRGHNFERLGHNHSESVTIVLPGAYDRVSVRILDP